jgi:uncharacterized protein (TIGR02391 family)
MTEECKRMSDARAMRRKILEELYELAERQPGAWGIWTNERNDESTSRFREARYLEERGLVEGTIGAQGDLSLRLTARGRDYFEAGGDWNPPEPEPRRPAVARVEIENLHPEIVKVSSALFTDGHYSQAIYDAFKAVEVRVRGMSGLDKSGKDLMAQSFKSDLASPPIIDVRTEAGRSGEDEQEGFRFLFMGAIVGIRNPKAHEFVNQTDPQRAIEYLAFASVLMRRLDDAKTAIVP